ncbi:serine/threonine protein kinase [Coccidioides immitis RS]|uniref:Serine/threonine protein kinase n=4 Tax=Coccidioides immitis TaxID=5501 RepID=A0A0E1RUF9_COCIM|nr:serine/threonine protein kinase [Coccidioides immitis RS]KMP09414.1 hypothetical protein CIRG_09584 [Coccidioides immitis RMSCC 2394]KMU75347.1 hypothetical protein CISG_04766 [Coccidioides immitis RMSCC 3703]KMU88503.1 hypothetical protein CIHG_06303 [Coccidioides immitis H538.4]TPX20239.1 hypothetical protein DIZ76_016127 [Coccidioides immitis]EAS27457.2 serine/threonine protein kinase [Coccidioides immitis RS]
MSLFFSFLWLRRRETGASTATRYQSKSKSEETTVDNDETFRIDIARYSEKKWSRGQEPRNRSLHAVASRAHSQWHISVSFEGSLYSDGVTRARVEKRRQDLEDLCRCLDFGRLRLLDDTVTQVFIRRENDATLPSHEYNIAVTHRRPLPLKRSLRSDSEYTPVFTRLWFCIREDPFHVRFPLYRSAIGIPTIDLLEIRRTCELSPGVHKVHLEGDKLELLYVYKEVDSRLYIPRDSQVLDQELQNLQLFRGEGGIVQIIAAVISKNPYQTTPGTDSSNQTVLRGILLEYHPKGTLFDALQGTSPKPWVKWALQIAHGLACLHQSAVTHMDLKPSNVVISADGNAVLIDISGIGGTTREWLAPEMHDVTDPLSESLKARIQNDIWAFGQMLSAMAKNSCNSEEEKLLRRVAVGAMANPSSRSSLHDIISQLSSK